MDTRSESSDEQEAGAEERWMGKRVSKNTRSGTLTLHSHTTNHPDLLLHCDWLVALVGSPSCVMFSMPVKVNFDGGECCWEEEEEEEEELCCGRAGGGKAGSPFKEGSFVGFLSWVSGTQERRTLSI